MGSVQLPTAPSGPTGRLCNWIDSVTLDDIPSEIKQRAKYLILDGLACGLIGAHLPWSEKSVKAVLEMEAPGSCNIIGHEKKVGPLAAALLNSAFIQGFELDDYHSLAPLHSNSIILPALLAASEHLERPVKGADLLLATIVGYEVGPRVGLGLYGSDMLSRGFHSGAVFGPSASAASVSKLLQLPADKIEDALGIACTQACGLMSAQYESEVKRMQHGFAARNGLFAALMARGGYIGIKQVYERPYGGFLAAFGQGSGRDPPYCPEEIAKGLGDSHIWQIHGIRPKAYAAMAGTHCTIDCIRMLQKLHPQELQDLNNIKSILIEIASEAVYKHGGWKPHRQNFTTTGAQMSNQYAAAVQLVDHQVLPAQFREDLLDRDILWGLVSKMECVQNESLGYWWSQRITINFHHAFPSIVQQLKAPFGVDPEFSNDDILQKWRQFTKGIIDGKRQETIEKFVLDLDCRENIAELIEMLSGVTANPIA